MAMADTAPLTDNEITEILLTGQGQAAPEPGDFRVRDVVNKGAEGDPDAAPPMAVGQLTSAGYTYIFDTRTGERSLTNNNMLPTQLRKVREDGSRVFTTMTVEAKKKSGKTHKCLLHTDRRTTEMDEAGLPECRKANLTSEFQVRRHMQTRHKVEWATLEDQRQQREREEDRAFRLSLMEGRAAVQPAPAAPAKRPLTEKQKAHLARLNGPKSEPEAA